MTKILGVILIFAGCLCGVMSWEQTEKNKQEICEAWMGIFAGWEYSLRCKNMRLYDFLLMREKENDDFKDFFAEVRKMLEENTYPTGLKIWKKAFEKYEKKLAINSEAREIILFSGSAFFAKSSAESLKYITVSAKRMQSCLESMRTGFYAKKRLLFPAGMLAGLAIVILLI